MKMHDNFGDTVNIFESFDEKYLVVIFENPHSEIEMNFDLDKVKKINAELEKFIKERE